MSIATLRRPPGEVRDAIHRYLAKRGQAATVAQIRQGVAELLKGELSESSVRSYLRLKTPADFERTGHGTYRLKDVRPAPRPSLPTPKEVKPAFQYNRATLYQCDALEWLDAQPEQSIHAIVTDPPYGLVEYRADQQTKLHAGRGGVWRIPPSFDGHQRSPLPRFTVLDDADMARLQQFFHAWGEACLRVLVPGGHIAVASNPLVSHRAAGALSDAGLERRGEIIRLVMTLRGGDRPKNAHQQFPEVSVMARSMWEPWLLFRKPFAGRVQDNLRRWGTGGLRRPAVNKPFGDVIASHPTRPKERRLAPHPSLKPQSFLRRIVRAMLPLGEGIVLDTFAGSGSTLAAAEAVGYQSIGVERDPRYIDLAREAIPRLHRFRPKAEEADTPSFDEGQLFPLG